MNTRSTLDDPNRIRLIRAVLEAVQDPDGSVRDAVVRRWDEARSSGTREAARATRMQELEARIAEPPTGTRADYPEEPEAATDGWIDPDEVPSRRSRWVFLHGADPDETDE